MSRNSKTWIRWLLIAWASPNSVIGLFFGVLALLSGGGVHVRRGCVEFHGGLIERVFCKLLGGEGVSAMTLGHTILGQTPKMLSESRDHEHVHVLQYERWGPFFLPAYLGSSLILWMRGRECYLENPFEVEAYAIAPLASPSSQTDDDPETQAGDKLAETAVADDDGKTC